MQTATTETNMTNQVAFDYYYFQKVRQAHYQYLYLFSILTFVDDYFC